MRECRLGAQKKKCHISAGERHTGVPHPSREPRDGSIRQNFGWKLYVSDTWVKQEPRTLDPEWRDSAGRAKKGNNSSRRSYIRPQSAGSWISRSQGVNLPRSVNCTSQSTKSSSSKSTTSYPVIGSSAVASL